MKRRFAFTSVLVIAAMLIAAVPAAANGDGPTIYWEISEDGMYASLQFDVDIQVFEGVAVDCNGGEWSWELDPPWDHLNIYSEEGYPPLAYVGAYLSYWDGEEWSEPFWVNASRSCVVPPAEIGTVCFEGKTTHVVGLGGWMVKDTLVNFAEGDGYINYMPEPPSEAHETWEEEVVYADAIFAFWEELAEEWIYSDIIVGTPCAGEAAKEPVVTGLWAYVNPGAEVGARNICYILSLTQPTQSEESNDVQRLCFTEVAPDWWQGAVLLAQGDVFENGTDWGYWEGDALASAFSGAKRLPLHAEGPNNDLLDKAEGFPWTQGN